jgi:hypothetical protein
MFTDVPAPPGAAGASGAAAPVPAAPGTPIPAASPGSTPQGGNTGEATTTPSTPPQPPADLSERVFDAGSDPNRNQITAGNVCERLAQIQCAGEAFCCESPGRDRTACEADMFNGCMGELYLDAMSLNSITGFDAAAASTAFGEIERMASTCDVSVAAYGVSPNGLMGMFRGSVSDGSSCSPGIRAASDQALAAAALASCSNITTTACLPTSALSWSCKPRGDVGAECFTDLNCLDGLHCPNPDFDIGAATCAPRKAVGSPCQLPNECESLFCKGGTCVTADAQAAYCLAQ